MSGRQARHTAQEPVVCTRCTLLFACTVVILVCLLCYIPIMLTIKSVPRFDWGPAVDRNTSRYIQPDYNTTLLQPPDVGVDTCQPFLLIVVSSAVSNFPARNAIRETWGAPTALPASVLLRFLVGTTSNHSLTDNIAAEGEVHGDVVQQDFIDVYSNLTLKSVMMLKWATGQCRPQFILKTDEDMFINVPRLEADLRKIGHPDVVLGSLICNAEPMRDKFSKYYTPRYMFAPRHFPVYVSGTAYVLGGAVARRLYQAALGRPLYHLEDVFVTGMCAEQIGVKPVDHTGFSFWRRALDACEFRRVVSAHEVTPAQLRDVWRTLTSTDIEARCAANVKAAPRKPVKCRSLPMHIVKRRP